ncbi:methyltransferase domain-containing protein [Aeromicrobium terrae]|uniref:methyltransferase domain-containing protein n=1 Tax=Aeromicrobium terrae TaxID=2498846 RepID=UPI001E64F88B|nr:methyltransferase domain-containing protein [Aeromicrobium terrae]
MIRTRADGARELRVNGVFVMDDVETSSERRLAELVLERGARDVLVGGLGLGFTTRRLLEDTDVRRVLVAELHPAVVESSDIEDPRAEVVVGDVRTVLAEQPDASFDAVLLDVDNGPDFLVHDANAGLYEPTGVADAVRVLRPGGTLAVWSMADSPALRDALAEHLEDVQAEAVPVRLQRRDEAYWVLTGRRSPGDIVRA